MTDDFIGKGEEKVAKILARLFHTTTTFSQIPLNEMVPNAPDQLGDEYSRHKVDIVIPTEPLLAVEVNYKHGTKADQKIALYFDILKYGGYQTCAIDDNECESLFKSEEISWDDYIDVINALKMAGVKP